LEKAIFLPLVSAEAVAAMTPTPNTASASDAVKRLT
jgi:hypothetical protein